ncbi:MAG: GntP family permease [Verrucomicrobia bacterium]|nr:GntP family permease [Verrucomicrobiota bacterium]
MDPLWIFLLGMVVVLGGILALRLHAFLALVLGALVVAALTPAAAVVQHGLSKKLTPEAAQKLAGQPVIERVTREFGATAGRIGVLIAFASIVGKCILDSGGADRIVRSTLRVLGEQRTPLALISSGFLLGIPVFFETVFLLLIPLGKAMRMRTGRDYTLYVLCIIAGATMTHSLVPPTPGPLFVAKELNVDMGLMILAGCVVGAITATSGWLYARWINRRLDIPLRDTAKSSLTDVETLMNRDEKLLPPFWLAVMPILLPVLLISAATPLETARGAEFYANLFASCPAVMDVIRVLGDSTTALGIAALIALGTVVMQGKKAGEVLDKGVGVALEEAGLIILIIAAGGAFGGVLQQTGIGPRLQELSATHSIGILPLAWAVTAVVRIAQGSATVAMVTAVGMLGGMAKPELLGFHPVWVALAIGCGSKMGPWMNDSGFWVICKVSGFTEKECLSTFTVMLSMMGVVGLGVVMLLAKLFPLV